MIAIVSPRAEIKIIIGSCWNQNQSFRFRKIIDPGTRPEVDQPAPRVRETCLRQPIGVREMATQIVMDRTGDTRHSFDVHDRAEVEKAERRFKELTGAGFTAAVRSGPGEQKIIRSFDPTAEETLFYPRLVGG